MIPIGFLWKEENLVVCTAPSAPKVAALNARPNVAVTIDTGNTSATAKQLLIRGIAVIEIVEWARFYDFGAGKLPPFLRRLAEDDHDRAGAA